MKFLARLLVAFLAYSVDVVVKAETSVALPNDYDGVQIPEDCRRAFACAALVADAKKLTLKKDNETRLILGPAAIGAKLTNGNMSLIEGSALLKSSARVQLNLLYGGLRSQGGYVWIEKTNDGFQIVNVNAEVEVFSRAGEKIQLLPGQNVVLLPLGPAGNSIHFVRASDYKDVVRKMAPIFDGDKNQFRELVLNFQLETKAQVQNLADLYQEFSIKRVASYERERSARESSQRKLEAAEAEIRREFRERHTLIDR